MIEKYKEILCNLAIKILHRYKVGHSEDLRRFTYVKHDGKYYAINHIKVETDEYGETLEIDAHDLNYFIKKYST